MPIGKPCAKPLRVAIEVGWGYAGGVKAAIGWLVTAIRRNAEKRLPSCPPYARCSWLAQTRLTRLSSLVTERPLRVGYRLLDILVAYWPKAAAQDEGLFRYFSYSRTSLEVGQQVAKLFASLLPNTRGATRDKHLPPPKIYQSYLWSGSRHSSPFSIRPLSSRITTFVDRPIPFYPLERKLLHTAITPKYAYRQIILRLSCPITGNDNWALLIFPYYRN